jgi:hypothetical protein
MNSHCPTRASANFHAVVQTFSNERDRSLRPLELTSGGQSIRNPETFQYYKEKFTLRRQLPRARIARAPSWTVDQITSHLAIVATSAVRLSRMPNDARRNALTFPVRRAQNRKRQLLLFNWGRKLTHGSAKNR